MEQKDLREQGSSPLVIIVVILILATLYFVLRPASSLNEPVPTNLEDSSVTTTSSVENSEFNTFSSSDYNFSVNYPKDWDYVNSSDTFLMIDFYPSSEGAPDHGQATRVTVTAMKGEDNFTSMHEWTEVVDYVEIDGVQAELRKHKTAGSKTIFFSKDDIYYRIDPVVLDFDPSTNDDEDREAVFNQITNSFKFIH